MNAPLENDINNYITPFLLRYFQKATSLATAKQDIDIRRDLKLLRMHWSISRPLRELVDHVRKNPHEVAAILKSRVREDDARVLGRFDACASAIRRMKTGRPTLVVSHEPLRAYSSGPNRALVWVLGQAWRWALCFQEQLSKEGASYRDKITGFLPALEQAQRFEGIRHAGQRLDLARRPSPQDLKEARRSRRPIYLLACQACQTLQNIEAGDEDAVCELLNDTLLAPQEDWKRFELAFGIGIARALSYAKERALSDTSDKRSVLANASEWEISLHFLFGGERQAVAAVGEYEIHWQSRTEAWRDPEAEPSEEAFNRLLKHYGLYEGASRPDLVVLNKETNQAVAVIEVKYFQHKEDAEELGRRGRQAIKDALRQLIRYTRGYRNIRGIGETLNHSIIALAYSESQWRPRPRPYGLPLIVGFKELAQDRLNEWACRLLDVPATPQ